MERNSFSLAASPRHVLFQGRAVGAVVSSRRYLVSSHQSSQGMYGEVFSQNSAGGLGPMTVSLEKGGMLTAVLAKESMSSF